MSAWGPLLKGCLKDCVDGDPKPGASAYSRTCVIGSRIDASNWSAWTSTLCLVVEAVGHCQDEGMPPPRVSIISTQ